MILYTLRCESALKKNLQKTKRCIISSFWRDRDKPDRSGAIFSGRRTTGGNRRQPVGARMFVSTTTECERRPRVDKRKQIDAQWGDDALIANSFGNRPLDVESSVGFCTAGGHKTRWRASDRTPLTRKYRGGFRFWRGFARRKGHHCTYERESRGFVGSSGSPRQDSSTAYNARNNTRKYAIYIYIYRLVELGPHTLKVVYIPFGASAKHVT